MEIKLKLKHNFECLRGMLGLMCLYFVGSFDDQHPTFASLRNIRTESKISVYFEEDTVTFAVEDDIHVYVLLDLAQEIDALETLFLGGWKEQFPKIGTLTLVHNKFELALACSGNGHNVDPRQFDGYSGGKALVYFDTYDSTVHLSNFKDILSNISQSV